MTAFNSFYGSEKEKAMFGKKIVISDPLLYQRPPSPKTFLTTKE
jgi:hypothetical protein